MLDDEIKLEAEAGKDVGGQIRDLFLSGYGLQAVMEALGLTEDEVNEHQRVRQVDVQFDQNVDAGFESQEGVQIPVEPLLEEQEEGIDETQEEQEEQGVGLEGVGPEGVEP
ncbi:hypothetical protein LXL04_017519 [Taraxacum kok-saghyz]